MKALCKEYYYAVDNPIFRSLNRDRCEDLRVRLLLLLRLLRSRTLKTNAATRMMMMTVLYNSIGVADVR